MEQLLAGNTNQPTCHTNKSLLFTLCFPLTNLLSGLPKALPFYNYFKILVLFRTKSTSLCASALCIKGFKGLGPSYLSDLLLCIEPSLYFFIYSYLYPLPFIWLQRVSYRGPPHQVVWALWAALRVCSFPHPRSVVVGFPGVLPPSHGSSVPNHRVYVHSSVCMSECVSVFTCFVRFCHSKT